MFIQPFITRRIRAKMKELTLKDVIELCEIPVHLNELGTSAALEKIIEETSLPLSEWTAQERIVALSHYLVAQENGDFAVTEQSQLSDFYLESDYPENTYQFNELEIVPITADYLEAIERAVLAYEMPNAWLIGAMAASIKEQGDEWNGTPDEFVQENIKRLLTLPESEFLNLVEHFYTAQEALAHGIEIAFLDGIVAVSQKGEKTNRELVKFCFDTLISEEAKRLFRRNESPNTHHQLAPETGHKANTAMDAYGNQ